MITLRDYQSECIKALFSFLKATRGQKNQNTLIQMPTGGGKSLVQAHAINKMIGLSPMVRVLCLCHSTEIIKQNYEEYISYTKNGNAGIYCGKLKRKDDSQILFSSIQSIAKSELYKSRVDIIIIDEAHLCSNKMQGQYREFIDNAQKYNPKMRIIGMTATPWRMDNGCLIQGEDALFSSICYTVTIKDLIDRKMLSIIKTPDKNSLVTIDCSELKINRAKNDYTNSSMEEAVSGKLNELVPDFIKRAEGRNHVVVFCPSIKICNDVCDILKAYDQTCEQFIGSTKEKGENGRKSIKARFESGETRWLVSVDALTTGFNAKCVDCLVVLRPTQSSSLWIQILGRGMRILLGKEDCLLLDYGENISRHGSVEYIEAPPQKVKRNGGGEMVYVKTCPDCKEDMHMSSKECPKCGYQYPVIERRFSEVEENKDVLFDGSNQKKQEYWYNVKGLEFAAQTSKNHRFVRLKVLTNTRPYYLAYFMNNKKFQNLLVQFYEKGVFRPGDDRCSFDDGMKIIAEASSIAASADVDAICDHANGNIKYLKPSKVKISYEGKYPEVKDFSYE